MQCSKNCCPITEENPAAQGGQVWYWSPSSDRGHASICALAMVSCQSVLCGSFMIWHFFFYCITSTLADQWAENEIFDNAEQIKLLTKKKDEITPSWMVTSIEPSLEMVWNKLGQSLQIWLNLANIFMFLIFPNYDVKWCHTKKRQLVSWTSIKLEC